MGKDPLITRIATLIPLMEDVIRGWLSNIIIVRKVPVMNN